MTASWSCKGKDRGKEGLVMRVLPKDGKVIVEGVNIVKKHQKQTRATMQAGIIEKDMPIDASNVAVVSQAASRAASATAPRPTAPRSASPCKTGEVLS